MKSTAVLAAALALSLWSVAAQAQAPGDTVRLETSKGPVEGTLVDRLPKGYLIKKGKGTVVVPYVTVSAIHKVAPEPLAPMTLKPAPAAKGSRKDPAGPASADTFQGLAIDPAPAAPGPAGVEPPLPPPVPELVAPPPPPPVMAPAPALSPVMVPVPALPAKPRPSAPIQHERRSKIVMGTGIAFVALGAIAVVTGVGLVIDGASQPDTVCEKYTSGERCFANRAKQPRIDAGRITWLAGSAVHVLGYPIWSIGGKKVPVKGPAPKAELTAGPGQAALTLRF